ncbi:MAG TPA: nuclear transport factor 2 family protein [Acidimicrobiia bacterium]|nr:nuclear transport factor 2 family protein [Acidimicrobiia bacterium]
MAEHPDITLIRKGYEAFNRADVATLSEILASDVEQHMVGDNLVSGDYKGRDNVLGFYGKLAELTGGTYGCDIESMFTDGRGKVVVVHRQRGERNGRTIAPRQALIFTVAGGKVVDLHDTTEDLEAEDTFWS